MAESKYSCFLMIELTLFFMFVLGFVFMFNIDTELMGFMIAAFTHFVLFVVVMYNILRANAKDMIAFSIFVSCGLAFGALLVCTFYLYKANKERSVASDQDPLKGLARDIVTMFKVLYVVCFVFFAILYTYYLWNQSSVSVTDIPFIISAVFALNRGAELTHENVYALVTAPLCMVLLGVASYNVYIISFLNKIVVLG